MNKESLKPMEWIKKVPIALIDLDAIPILGNPPPFSWDGLAKILSKTLNIGNFNLAGSELNWRSQEELFSGLGEPLAPLAFSMAPFEGLLYWAMAKEDLKDLMSFLLLKGERLTKSHEEEYLEGFYDFLAIEIIHSIETLKFDPDVAPKLVQHAEPPRTSMLCMDINFTIDGKNKSGRLFFPPQLQKSMAAHYAKKTQFSPFQSPLSEKLEVILHAEAGRVVLSQQEWAAVKPGDFILLDTCTLHPDASQGEVVLALKGYPFCKGEIKEGKVKILERSQTREVK